MERRPSLKLFGNQFLSDVHLPYNESDAYGGMPEMTVFTRAYSELLEALYAAPLDESQWQVFLTRLCDMTYAKVGFLICSHSALGTLTLASGGWPTPPEVARTYQEGYRYSDPVRQSLMRCPRIGVIEVDELIPHETFIAYPMVRTIMLPFGLEYGTCVVSSLCPRFFELISLWRTADRPFLDQDSVDLLEMLMPHLQNALKIRRTIRGSEMVARNAEALLNASETACILLDESGRILYLNEAAQGFVSASDGILVQDDRIVPVERSKRKQFHGLVTAARSADAGNPGGAIALGRGSSKRALQLHVSPLRLKTAHRSSVRVLILATDPDRHISFPDAILRQLYRLTPAETELANGLLSGFSLEEIAAMRKVSESTIRSQMKSVFSKTDTRRQGDLIRLLMTLPKRRTANTNSF